MSAVAPADVGSALSSLLNESSLSEEAFHSTFASVLRSCQATGECAYDWTAVQHLLALRLQSVYESFQRDEAASESAASNSSSSAAAAASDEFSWMCAVCRAAVSSALADGASPSSVNVPHCRRSASDEEPSSVRYERMLHLLVSFHRPPFTLQRMCDLLLEPRRYCRTTSKFLLAFSKLVCGITCDPAEAEAAFVTSWNDQKAAALGLPPTRFVTREEDEFLAGSVAATATSAMTHAVLPPQQYRVGMTAAEAAEAAAREAQARADLLAGRHQPHADDESENEPTPPTVDDDEAALALEAQQNGNVDMETSE